MKRLVTKVEFPPISHILHLLTFVSGFWAFYLVEVEGSSPQKLSVSRVISVPDSLQNFSLECPSQSPNSTLVLWILQGAHVVISSAGANVDNHNKFMYIKSTGELQINDVSCDDAGIYRCVVQSVSPAFVESSSTNGKLERYLYDTSAVELRVRESYSRPWEVKYKNLVRALMAAGAAILFFSVSCTVYSFRWKKPNSSNLNENFSSSSENLNLCEGGLKWESNEGKNELSGVESIGLNSNTDHFSRKDQRTYNTKVFVIPDPPPLHIENIRTSQIQGVRNNFNGKQASSTRMMLNSQQYGDNLYAEGEVGNSSSATNHIAMPDSRGAQQGSNYRNNFATTFSDYDWQKYWARHRNSIDTAPIASPESESSIITGESESEQSTTIHANSDQVVR